MPQTSRGASENQPWIQFMRQCAAEYRAQRAAAQRTGTAGDSSHDGASKRRVNGKQAPSAMVGAKAKAKPAKPVTEADQKALNKQVKQQGKARAKAKTKPTKSAKPVTDADQKALNKQVKQQGKARAKAKAKEADPAARK